jgi:transposase
MCLATILNGILWILQSGAPWRDLPKSFAPGLNRRTPHRRSLDSTFTKKKSRNAAGAHARYC